jgi:hypothetical protein
LAIGYLIFSFIVLFMLGIPSCWPSTRPPFISILLFNGYVLKPSR